MTTATPNATPARQPWLPLSILVTIALGRDLSAQLTLLLVRGQLDHFNDQKKEDSMMAQQHYQIRVQGHLGEQWQGWFDGLTITNLEQGEALLCGPLPDQAALHGVLTKIRDLGLPPLAVSRVAIDRKENTE